MALSEVLEEFRRCTTSDMLTGHRATIAIEAWEEAPTSLDAPTAEEHLCNAIDEACSVESPGWRLGVLLSLWRDHLSVWLVRWLEEAEAPFTKEAQRAAATQIYGSASLVKVLLGVGGHDAPSVSKTFEIRFPRR